jgi:hypothetical protein
MSTAEPRRDSQPTIQKMASPQPPRIAGDKRAWLMAGIGAGGLALNHWRATDAGKVSIWLLIFGPMLLFLGLAGLYDLRYMLGAGKYGKDLPRKYRVVSTVLLIAGLAASVWLAFGFYRVTF